MKIISSNLSTVTSNFKNFKIVITFKISRPDKIKTLLNPGIKKNVERVFLLIYSDNEYS